MNNPSMNEQYRVEKHYLVRVGGLLWYRTIQRAVEWMSGYRVMSGPFKGMKYPKEMIGNALHSKYLGIYEKEIHSVWRELESGDFSKVIDVGGAEGYYVVGAALSFPNAQIIGFEAGEDGQNSILKMAKFNNVESRVKVKGFCQLTDLANAISDTDGRVLIIMDVEGAEIQLLNPVEIPQLRKATILLETHDCWVPDCSNIIRDRFSASHKIQTISSCPRTHDDLPFPCPGFLAKWFLHVGSDQRASIQNWFLMTPISEIINNEN